ncbi:MAG: hypothetical protein ACD_73C00031G0006 [uncultured bacterium]|nr:MAG: hypothetical protein ACD_73C00031G0006 [uncultured bacterium]
MSQIKMAYDGTFLTNELRHLGSSMPWLHAASQPKSKMGIQILKLFGELCAATIVVCLIASVI